METIKDVAERAGVSITTVSHVINRTRYVSDDLTQKVFRAMEELNYQPNILARSLRNGRTKTIGLLIPDISNLFFAEVARKIEDRGHEHGYNLILCNTDEVEDKERRYIEVLLAKKVDGIIAISAGAADSMFSNPHFHEIPVVIADRQTKEVFSDIVLIDNCRGGYEAVGYLVSLNHRRIGCISGPSLITPSAQRMEGYRKALLEAGIPVDEQLIRMGNFRFDGGEKEMAQLLRLPDPPTAVFVCNDMMALGAIRAIKDHNLDVPGDISVVGFDDIPLCKVVYPALTSVAQPIGKMAELVVELLIEKIQIKESMKRNKDIRPEYQKIVLETELMVRDSCRNLEEK